MDKAIGRGYGKLILFGEQFVVHGVPGIATGIDKYFQIEMEKIEENDIIIEDNVFYNETAQFSKDPEHIKCTTIRPFIDHFKINNVKSTFSGNLEKKGMGMSAAYAVATIRAANELFSLGLDDKEVNKWAYECEKVPHGNPSGIDNTCATYGKTIWFEKNMSGGENKIELFSLKKPLLLVIGNTCKSASTGELVAGVTKLKESDPDKYDPVFEDAKQIVVEAKQALESGDLEMIGELMNNNQALLREIGVSCDELEDLIEIALEKGALGAKLSGAGGGGIMFALAKNTDVQEEIAKAFEKEGYKAVKIVVGGVE